MRISLLLLKMSHHIRKCNLHFLDVCFQIILCVLWNTIAIHGISPLKTSVYWKYFKLHSLVLIHQSNIILRISHRKILTSSYSFILFGWSQCYICRCLFFLADFLSHNCCIDKIWVSNEPVTNSTKVEFMVPLSAEKISTALQTHLKWNRLTFEIKLIILCFLKTTLENICIN